jgi:hypothetical protein
MYFDRQIPSKHMHYHMYYHMYYVYILSTLQHPVGIFKNTLMGISCAWQNTGGHALHIERE